MRTNRESLSKARERFDAYIAAERAKSEADDAEIKRVWALLWRSVAVVSAVIILVWQYLRWTGG